MTDSTIVVLADSVRHLSRSLDSLEEIVRTMAIRHDCWLQTLQGQTALYLAVTVALVAVVATFNYVMGRAQIRDATRNEFARLSKKLEDKASAIESEMLRSADELKGDVFATVSLTAEGQGHWSSAFDFGLRSAILAAISGQWDISIARTKSVEATLQEHLSDISLTVAQIAKYRSSFNVIEDKTESAPARRRLEELFARLELVAVSPLATADQPAKDGGTSAKDHQ